MSAARGLLDGICGTRRRRLLCSYELSWLISSNQLIPAKLPVVHYRFRDFQNASLSAVARIRVKLVNLVESINFRVATGRSLGLPRFSKRVISDCCAVMNQVGQYDRIS